MLNSTAFVIRPAVPRDASALQSLAALDSQRPLTGPALIGEIDGAAAAAISVDSGRLVADPFVRTGALAVHLRSRATGMRSAARQPSLRRRIRAAIRVPATVPAPEGA